MACKEMRWKWLYWVHVVEVRDEWQAAVNMLMNVWVA
jgi:hypothetical protein